MQNSPTSSNFDKDGFIRSVAAFIKSLGLQPSSVKENDAFGLDFVIEDAEKTILELALNVTLTATPSFKTARELVKYGSKMLRMEIPHVHRNKPGGIITVRRMDRLKQALEEAVHSLEPPNVG